MTNAPSMIKEMAAESARWRADRIAKGTEVIKEYFPQEFEQVTKVFLNSECNVVATIDEYKHIQYVGYGAPVIWESELAIIKEMAVERGNGYQLISTNREIILITPLSHNSVFTKYFWKDGSKIKGKPRSRQMYTSTKGNYIIMNNKRIYINLKEAE